MTTMWRKQKQQSQHAHKIVLKLKRKSNQILRIIVSNQPEPCCRMTHQTQHSWIDFYEKKATKSGALKSHRCVYIGKLTMHTH